MKQVLIMALLLLTTASVKADDYAYLAFENGDGTTQTLPADGLKITYADGKIVAVSSNGSQTFTLSDLYKMYFANTSTAISDLSADTAGTSAVTVYTISGIQVGHYASLATARANLKAGLYLVKQQQKTFKIAVK